VIWGHGIHKLPLGGSGGSSLLLDQSTPQTVINGAPCFDAGIDLCASSDGVRLRVDGQSNLIIQQLDSQLFAGIFLQDLNSTVKFAVQDVDSSIGTLFWTNNKPIYLQDYDTGNRIGLTADFVGLGTDSPRGSFDINKTVVTTIDSVAYAFVTPSYSGALDLPNFNAHYSFDIYAVTSNGVYSPSCPSAFVDIEGDGSQYIGLVITWAKVSGAARYKIVVTDPITGWTGEGTIDTSDGYWADQITDNGSTLSLTYGLSNNRYYPAYEYPVLLTPTSLSSGTDFYVDSVGDLYSAGGAEFKGSINLYDDTLNWFAYNKVVDWNTGQGQLVLKFPVNPSYSGQDNTYIFDSAQFLVNNSLGQEIFWLIEDGTGAGYMKFSDPANGKAFSMTGKGIQDGNTNNNLLGFEPSEQRMYLGSDGMKLSAGFIPTSPSGLASGDIWVDGDNGNVLKMV